MLCVFNFFLYFLSFLLLKLSMNDNRSKFYALRKNSKTNVFITTSMNDSSQRGKRQKLKKTFKNKKITAPPIPCNDCDQMATLFCTFVHLHQRKFAQWRSIFAKVGPKYCQIVNKPSKILPKTLQIWPVSKFCQIWSHCGCNNPCPLSLNNKKQNLKMTKSFFNTFGLFIFILFCKPAAANLIKALR